MRYDVGSVAVFPNLRVLVHRGLRPSGFQAYGLRIRRQPESTTQRISLTHCRASFQFPLDPFKAIEMCGCVSPASIHGSPAWLLLVEIVVVAKRVFFVRTNGCHQNAVHQVHVSGTITNPDRLRMQNGFADDFIISGRVIKFI